jgi:hypothetical protein
MHPTEERYPIQTKEFKAILERAYDLHLQKNLDYSSANIIIAGEIGIIVRVWDKFCRICNLLGITFPTVKPKIVLAKEQVLLHFKPNTQEYKKIEAIFDDLVQSSSFDWESIKRKNAINESLEDAWYDMAVYCIIGMIENKGKWGR